MSRWKEKEILIYFEDITGSSGENCLPYMPESFTCNVNGRNEEIDILHYGNANDVAGTINILKRPGLKTWSIESFFSHPSKPMYATVSKSSKWTPEQWVEFFESAMYEQKVIEMTVTGIGIVTYVTVEKFKHTKEAGEELDTYYTLDLKEYQYAKISQQTINIEMQMPPTYTGDLVNGVSGNGSSGGSGGRKIDSGGVKPTQGNIGNDGYLLGKGWKSISSSTGLVNPYTFNDGTPVSFVYLPIKVLEKDLTGGIQGIGLNSSLKSVASEAYSILMEGHSIYSKPKVIEFLETCIQIKKINNNVKDFAKIYVNAKYGSTNAVMTYNDYISKENGGDLFLQTLLSTKDYQRLRVAASNGFNSNYDSDLWYSGGGQGGGTRGSETISNKFQTILKIRNLYTGKWSDSYALAKLNGGAEYYKVQASTSINTKPSAGDLKRNEYQGTAIPKAFTINAGDTIYMYKKDYVDNNNGISPSVR